MLARLLALNAQRAEEERLAGLAGLAAEAEAEAKPKRRASKKKAAKGRGGAGSAEEMF